MHPKCRYRLWGAFFNTLLSLLIYKIVDENICSVSNFSKFAIFF